MGLVANEINHTLNTVLAYSPLIPILQDSLSRVANELNHTVNTVINLNSSISTITIQLDELNKINLSLSLLSARNNAVLISKNTVKNKKLIVKRFKPSSLSDQIEKMRKLAPNNIDNWIAAYEAGVSEGLRTVEGNLSHDGHIGAEFFRMFINIHARERILDFGCGPLEMPSYLTDWPTDQLAAFDPQDCAVARRFPVAKTFGETIPWPDASFETVVIATSLDHVYLLDRALAEVKRVLVPNGRLLLWTAMLESSVPYNPYGLTITPPDKYHLFHPGKNWFYKLFETDYNLIERMKTVAGAEMLAFIKK
jgi:SAM-dependent methyltransferase